MTKGLIEVLSAPRAGVMNECECKRGGLIDCGPFEIKDLIYSHAHSEREDKPCFV